MKKTLTWKQLAPEGVSAKKEAVFTGAALAASGLWSLTVLRRMATEWDTVAPSAAQGKVVSLIGWQGMLGTALFGFYFIAIAMAILAMWHYVKIKKSAASGQDDIHIRAMAMPALGVILALCLSMILYFAYRAAYLDYRERIEEMFNSAYHAIHG